MYRNCRAVSDFCCLKWCSVSIISFLSHVQGTTVHSNWFGVEYCMYWLQENLDTLRNWNHGVCSKFWLRSTTGTVWRLRRSQISSRLCWHLIPTCVPQQQSVCSIPGWTLEGNMAGRNLIPRQCYLFVDGSFWSSAKLSDLHSGMWNRICNSRGKNSSF
jgi:hypothetical protein